MSRILANSLTVNNISYIILQGPELGMFDSICTEMSCKVPGSGRSYRIYKAATGTSCGDKKVNNIIYIKLLITCSVMC